MSKSISVKIPDEKIWDQFKNFVKNKRGKTHTAMGEELQGALINHMNRESNPSNMETNPQGYPTRTHISENERNLSGISNETSRSSKYQSLLQYAKEYELPYTTELGEESTAFNILMLKEYIKENIGRDERTINKYIGDVIRSYRIVEPRSGKPIQDLSPKEMKEYIWDYHREFCRLQDRERAKQARNEIGQTVEKS